MAHRNSYMNFVKHYDLIREVLRQYYIVGLSSNTAKKSKRDYNNRVRRVKNFIADEFLEHDNINKIKYNRFYIENYTKAHNFLYDSYLIKNIDVEVLKAYFIILQVLNKYGEVKNCALMQEVTDIVEWDEIISNKNDLEQFLERVKNKMVSLGVIEKQKKGRDTILNIRKDIFENFTEEEIIQIINSLSFYSNVSIISEPGYSTIDVLDDYLLGERNYKYKFESTFSFKQNFLSRILDDEVISVICESIKDNTIVKFLYKGKNIEVMPKEIISEYSYGRQYLLAKDLKYNNYSKYRIDKISNCKKGRKYLNIVNDFQKERKKVKIEIDFYIDENNEEYLIRRVRKEGNGEFEKLEQNHFLYTEQVEDCMSLLPWIRSFGTIAKVRESEQHNLSQKIQKEYEELLKIYGEIWFGGVYGVI
mgnify:CR=1 FL=1